MTKNTGVGILVLLTIIMVTLAAFSMGCTNTDNMDTDGISDNQNNGDVEVTPISTSITLIPESANGGEIKLKSGESVLLRLDENPSTGYSWELYLPDVFMISRDTFIRSEDEVVGAGGVHEWVFVAGPEGTYQIDAVYKRPWEDITGSEERFSVSVLVEGVMSMPEPVDADDEEYVRGTAVVEDVEVLIMESFPVQASVLTSGYLPDGCTVLAEDNTVITRDGNAFNVILETKRPKDALCTEAIVPYEVSIPLDVYGLDKGVYTVDVNGIEGTFELTVDNI